MILNIRDTNHGGILYYNQRYVIGYFLYLTQINLGSFRIHPDTMSWSLVLMALKFYLVVGSSIVKNNQINLLSAGDVGLYLQSLACRVD